MRKLRNAYPDAAAKTVAPAAAPKAPAPSADTRPAAPAPGPQHLLRARSSLSPGGTRCCGSGCTRSRFGSPFSPGGISCSGCKCTVHRRKARCPSGTEG
ncbi:hypothetical protein AHiyo4_16790 [Arthrobacter sp. Hiyo4]|nr:hypothetical protein AHiyo4_16790 [Arthrobacter sp. Hiyo4]